MERSERRTRSPDGGSDRRSRRRSSRDREHNSGGHRRRSRSWSRSRSRDRDRRSSHRRYHSRSRSRSHDRYGDQYHHHHHHQHNSHNDHQQPEDLDGYGHQQQQQAGSSRQYDRDYDRHHSHHRGQHNSHSSSSYRSGGGSGGGGGGGGSEDRRSSRYSSRGDGDYDRRNPGFQHDDRVGGRGGGRGGRDRSDDSFLDELQSNYSFDGEPNSDLFRSQQPSNKVIILKLAPHVTEADICNDLNQYGLRAASIQLVRKRKTGASRGFAFVEFDTQEEATRWMEEKQGVLVINDQFRAVMQYSVPHQGSSRRDERLANDWYCVKCGVYNFKRRESCYRCSASREESEKGGEGSDEVSTVLTKKILLRNLDTLTNEEGVLTHMQRVVPQHCGQIAKIQVCRDPLTSTSRGVCYLAFDNLVDSMNTHNALKALEPALSMEGRDVMITYCVDSSDPANSAANASASNHPASATHPGLDWRSQQALGGHNATGGGGSNGLGSSSSSAAFPSSGHHHHPQQLQQHRYTLADVPRLAEYSAGVYASNPLEHEHYRKYYTDYYVAEIAAGNWAGLPTMAQIDAAEHAALQARIDEAAATAAATAAEAAAAQRLMGANSGAAVALSAIQRKQQQGGAGAGSGSGGRTQRWGRGAEAGGAAESSASQQVLQVPTGRDNRKYPTPDVSTYQYDDQSTYYYDATTGLYYDANSQYYYNGESGEYLYWNAELSTYTVAPGGSGDTASAPKAHQDSQPPKRKRPAAFEATNDTDFPAQPVAPQPPSLHESPTAPAAAAAPPAAPAVGSDKVKVAKKIVKDMERWAKQLNQKKEYYQVAPADLMAAAADDERQQQQLLLMEANASCTRPQTYGGSSSNRYADVGFAILENKERAMNPAATAALLHGGGAGARSSTLAAASSAYESDSEGEQQQQQPKSKLSASSELVAYDTLTCLLCKRAFGSAEILAKHVQMSQLHKDNLRKLQQQQQPSAAADASDDPMSLSYRDRAKERRLKYGEPEPPPVTQSARDQWAGAAGAAGAKGGGGGGAAAKAAAAQAQVSAASAAAGKKAAAQPIGQNNVGNRLLQKMGWQQGQGLGRANQGRTNIIEAESRAGAAGLGTKATVAFVPGDDYKTYIKRMMKSRYDQAED